MTVEIIIIGRMTLNVKKATVALEQLLRESSQIYELERVPASPAPEVIPDGIYISARGTVADRLVGLLEGLDVPWGLVEHICHPLRAGGVYQDVKYHGPIPRRAVELVMWAKLVNTSLCKRCPVELRKEFLEKECERRGIFV